MQPKDPQVREQVKHPSFRQLQHFTRLCCSLYQGLNSCSDSSRYVLCLDDDVELHPRSLRELVSSLEQDATLFMATGECTLRQDPLCQCR